MLFTKKNVLNLMVFLILILLLFILISIFNKFIYFCADVFSGGIFKTIEENCKSVELRNLAEKMKGTLLHAQAESTKSK